MICVPVTAIVLRAVPADAPARQAAPDADVPVPVVKVTVDVREVVADEVRETPGAAFRLFGEVAF